MPSHTESLHFWHLALQQPLGIWLRTPDPMALKSILYSARAKAKDPSLAHLQIRTAAHGDGPGLGPTTHLWIVNPSREEAPTPLPTEGA